MVLLYLKIYLRNLRAFIFMLQILFMYLWWDRICIQCLWIWEKMAEKNHFWFIQSRHSFDYLSIDCANYIIWSYISLLGSSKVLEIAKDMWEGVWGSERQSCFMIFWRMFAGEKTWNCLPKDIFFCVSILLNIMLWFVSDKNGIKTSE